MGAFKSENHPLPCMECLIVQNDSSGKFGQPEFVFRYSIQWIAFKPFTKCFWLSLDTIPAVFSG